MHKLAHTSLNVSIKNVTKQIAKYHAKYHFCAQKKAINILLCSLSKSKIMLKKILNRVKSFSTNSYILEKKKTKTV